MSKTEFDVLSLFELEAFSQVDDYFKEKITSCGLLSISGHDLILDGVSDVLLSLGEGRSALKLRESFNGVEEVSMSQFEGNS